MNSPGQSGISYELLVSSAYRWLRHIVFALIAFCVALNQTFFVFDLSETRMSFYLPVLYTSLFYLGAAYINLYVLIPHYLLKKKPVGYLIVFSTLLIGVNILLIGMEYIMINGVGLKPGESSYFYGDMKWWNLLLSDIIVLAFSLSGVSITVLLKYWFLENKQLNQLEALRGK